MASHPSGSPGSAAPEITDALRAVAERLEAESDDLSRRLAEHLSREVPAIGEDPEIRAEVQSAASASLGGWLGMVKRGLPASEIAPPDDVLAIAHTFVLRGAPLPALLRAFHVGHGFVIREMLATLQAEEGQTQALGPLIEPLLALSFAYIDAISVHLAEFYATERARLVRSAEAARAETARAILSGAPVDVDAASRGLGYELRRWHVGVVLWGDPGDETEDPLSRLEAVAGEIAGALGSARPLAVPAGRSLLWAWCGMVKPPSADELGALARGRRLGHAVSAALGEPEEGAEGFARSHNEALEARRVALLTRRPGTLTLYPDVDFLSLLAADAERARRFMRVELGALAEDDEATARLRTTLRVYLEEGRSFVAAARRIGSHENTVKYRVRRCEELLGRPVVEGSLKLAAALLLAETLGPGD